MIGRRALLWLVPLWITLHNLEELVTMPSALASLPAKIPGWLESQFRLQSLIPTDRQFELMLLIVTVLPYLFACLGGVRRERGPRTWLLVGTQAVMLVNVLSHLGMMLYSRGYVPGLITALAINLPFSLYVWSAGVKNHWLRWSDLGVLLPVALVVHLLGLFGLMAMAERLV